MSGEITSEQIYHEYTHVISCHRYMFYLGGVLESLLSSYHPMNFRSPSPSGSDPTLIATAASIPISSYKYHDTKPDLREAQRALAATAVECRIVDYHPHNTCVHQQRRLETVDAGKMYLSSRPVYL